jgi:transcriptional regulator with XRE-family HTH domain
VERAKKLMGERLQRLRLDAGLSVTKLAKLTKRDRTYIHDIEAGRANPTIEHYAELLSKCGVDFEDFLLGFRLETVPREHHEFHRMLSVILNSKVGDLVHGIRVNLEALSEKAARMKASQKKRNLS